MSLYTDFGRLKSTRLVQERAYARNYLGSAKLYGLAIPHYLLIGERIGCRPNSIFDPVVFRASSRTETSSCALIDYVDRFALSHAPPSREFEPGWYSWQNPDWRSSSHPNPFLHCLLTGLPEGRDPAPGIDLGQLSLATALEGEALVDRMFDEVTRNRRLDKSYAIYSFGELETRQNKFRSQLKLEFCRMLDSANNRCLVFAQAKGTVNRKYLNRPRSFDLLLNYYDTPPNELPSDADIIVFQRGTKTTSIHSLLTHRPEVLLRYDAVLFLDDDIEISSQGIANIFKSMQQYNLALAQPSLSAESDCVWSVFKQPNVGAGIRRVNSVEIMMPALTQRALVECGWVFSASISGFGVDLLLGKACSDGFGGKAGVVGESIAVHERRIDDKGGAFYNYMRSSGINPKFELWSIIQRYSVVPDFHYLDAVADEQASSLLSVRES